MLKIESATVINRPVEEVFSVLSNLENNPKWSSAFLEVKKTSDGPIAVGTTWRAVQKAFGQGLESEVEVTEYEPNRKWTQVTKSGPISGEVLVTFEPCINITYFVSNYNRCHVVNFCAYSHRFSAYPYAFL